MLSVHFSCFSSWKSLVWTITLLKHIIKSCRIVVDINANTHYKQKLIIRYVQGKTHSKEFACLAGGQEISKDSPLRKLNPVWKKRLFWEEKVDSTAQQCKGNKVPFYHFRAQPHKDITTKVKHKGRVIMEGSVHATEFWITGNKKCINSILHNSIVCNKLYRRTMEQKMAHLGADHPSTEPPFIH